MRNKRQAGGALAHRGNETAQLCDNITVYLSAHCLNDEVEKKKSKAIFSLLKLKGNTGRSILCAYTNYKECPMKFNYRP